MGQLLAYRYRADTTYKLPVYDGKKKKCVRQEWNGYMNVVQHDTTPSTDYKNIDDDDDDDGDEDKIVRREKFTKCILA